MMNQHLLAIIVPTLNEATHIAGTLKALRALKLDATIVVVDGGSDDDTCQVAHGLADVIIQTQPGRAHQMNAGAFSVDRSVRYLIFLHADTRLTHAAAKQLESAFMDETVWGRFDVQITGTSWMLGVIARLMNWRSRLTGMATGDQAIFVRRDVFESIGGFVNQPLMEDIELSKRLLQIARPVCLKGPAITSGRRWESRGVWRTIFLMWRLRYHYWRGASPDDLARQYR